MEAASGVGTGGRAGTTGRSSTSGRAGSPGTGGRSGATGLSGRGGSAAWSELQTAVGQVHRVTAACPGVSEVQHQTPRQTGRSPLRDQPVRLVVPV